MSRSTIAEKVIYDILDDNTELMNNLALLHLRVRDIDSYNDSLPAVGIKTMRVDMDNETGEEYAEGFCEVVCMGEYYPASILSEKIGDMIYETLNDHTEHIDGHDYQGVESSGYQPVQAEKDGMYLCLVHVFWKLWF